MNVFDIKGQWPLDDLAVIRLQGPDAASFLHSQLSNAVLDLSTEYARPAAYCTAQGRLLANMVVWKAADQGIGMLVAHDLAEALVKRLRLFVLRAKLSLEWDQNSAVTGIQGQDVIPQRLQSKPDWACLTQGADTWIAAPRGDHQPPAAWHIGPGSGSTLPQDASATPWHAAQIASGWPWIRQASQDMFLPSTLNMDINGSIDFKKGCYPGQEIVARSHYRGTVKRRLAWGVASWPQHQAIPAAGTDLYATNALETIGAPTQATSASSQVSARPVGRIIDCTRLDGQLYVAAEIAVSDGPAATYAVGAYDGPLLPCQSFAV